jgi:hypothetical protein
LNPGDKLKLCVLGAALTQRSADIRRVKDAVFHPEDHVSRLAEQ